MLSATKALPVAKEVAHAERLMAGSPGGPAGCGQNSTKIFASRGSGQSFCSSSAVTTAGVKGDANVRSSQEIGTLGLTSGRQHKSSDGLG